MNKAIVIVPSYNEKNNVEPLVKRVEEVFKAVKNWDLGILYVDGNSPDGTGEEVIKQSKIYKNIELLTEKKKAGLGAAYLYAMDYAFNKLKADVVFEFDADLSHDPKKIPDFLKKIDEGYDIVLGSRYIPGGSIPSNWGISRKIMSVLGNLVASLIMTDFSIRDWTGGYRALKKWVYEEFKNKIGDTSSYSFQIQILYYAKRANAKITEVPFGFIDRVSGKSKMPKLAYITSSLSFLITKRVREIIKSKFMKFAIVGFIGYLINASSLFLFQNVLLWPILISWLISTELAIISNFTWNNLWTFKAKKITGDSLAKKFLQFNGTSLGALTIQTTMGTLGNLIFGVGSSQIILPFIIVFMVLPYNYFMYNVVIWKTWKFPFLAKFLK